MCREVLGGRKGGVELPLKLHGTDVHTLHTCLTSSSLSFWLLDEMLEVLFWAEKGMEVWAKYSASLITNGQGALTAPPCSQSHKCYCPRWCLLYTMNSFPVTRIHGKLQDVLGLVVQCPSSSSCSEVWRLQRTTLLVLGLKGCDVIYCWGLFGHHSEVWKVVPSVVWFVLSVGIVQKMHSMSLLWEGLWCADCWANASLTWNGTAQSRATKVQD